MAWSCTGGPSRRSNGIVAAPLKSGDTLPPAGEFTVVAELLDPTVSVQSSAGDQDDRRGPGATPPVTRTSWSHGRAGVRVDDTYLGNRHDLYGDVPFYPVTFSFPTTGASATFTPQGGS